MLYTVAALAALAGTRYQVPLAAPPAEGFPNPNAGKVNDKIEHFVVLMMENRTPDHFFACMDLPKGDWVKEGHVIPMDPKDPSKGGATIKCGEAEYACKSGPGYDMFAGKVEPGGEDNFYPYGAQSDDNSYAHGAHGTSIQLFGKDALPVKKKIAEAFSIFNNYHSAVPSFSMPNHIWAQSATSAGINDNIDYIECGGIDPLFPQRTISCQEMKCRFRLPLALAVLLAILVAFLGMVVLALILARSLSTFKSKSDFYGYRVQQLALR